MHPVFLDSTLVDVPSHRGRPDRQSSVPMLGRADSKETLQAWVGRDVPADLPTSRSRLRPNGDIGWRGQAGHRRDGERPRPELDRGLVGAGDRGELQEGAQGGRAALAPLHRRQLLVPPRHAGHEPDGRRRPLRARAPHGRTVDAPRPGGEARVGAGRPCSASGSSSGARAGRAAGAAWRCCRAPTASARRSSRTGWPARRYRRPRSRRGARCVAASGGRPASCPAAPTTRSGSTTACGWAGRGSDAPSTSPWRRAARSGTSHEQAEPRAGRPCLRRPHRRRGGRRAGRRLRVRARLDRAGRPADDRRRSRRLRSRGVDRRHVDGLGDR